MKKLLFTLVTSSFYLQAFAQPNPVKFRFFSNKISNTVTEICIEARIDSGWQMFFSNMADGDPIKTGIRFKPSRHYRLSGNTGEPTFVTAYDDGLKMNIHYFTGKIRFTQKIITKKAKTRVAGTVEYMVSNDKTCLATELITFNIETGDKQLSRFQN